METIIKKIDEEHIDQTIIQEAGDIIKRGGLVAFPTETVYGLGANALDDAAAKKTYAAKGRPSDNPLIVHIASTQALDEIAVRIPEQTQALISRFWPGPLTLILEKSEKVPYSTTGGLDTVAVRMPKNQVARDFILASGGFVSAPSANTSGKPSPTTAEHVKHDLDGKIDMILDGGSVEIGLESTILDLTVSPPMILRPGAITAKMLQEVIPEVETDHTILGDESETPPKAPGMKYRHYAPRAPMTIVEGKLEDEILAIRQIAYDKTCQGKTIGIIATDETAKYYTHGVVKNIGTRGEQATIAKNLYGALRDFDALDVDEILSESFALKGIGDAIMNRLEKAAGHTRIEAASVVSEQPYRRIVFVSRSDTCRGPMAAELLRQQELKQEYVIDSRGVVVLFPEPVNPKAEAVMAKRKMGEQDHTAAAFSKDDIGDHILVLAMDEELKEKVISGYGDNGNIYTLNEFVAKEGELPDIYGQPVEAYEKCLDEMSESIHRLTNKLNAYAKGGETCQK